MNEDTIEAIQSVGVNASVDQDGDVVVQLMHPCQCHCTVAFLAPDAAEALAVRLQIGAAQGRIVKAGKSVIHAVEGNA
jgi:hypothetical protein